LFIIAETLEHIHKSEGL